MRLKFRYRIVIFVAIFVLFFFSGRIPGLAAYCTVASPFAGIATVLGSWNRLPFFLIVTLIFTMACLFWRRFLCRTFCPLGFCFDAIGKVRKNITGQNRLPRFLQRLPQWGVFLAVFTWLGCSIGVAGFLWLDPFILFSSAFHGHAADTTGTFPWIVWFFAALLAATWFLPTLWCRCFCPLGGTQDILYYPKLCYDKTKSEKHDSLPPRFHAQRRRFLVYTEYFAFFGFLFYGSYRLTNRAAFAAYRPQRPPGAVGEARFLALCTRCGACIQTCPTQLLRQGSQQNLIEIGCPQVVHSPTAWCKNDCTDCTKACPTGALQQLRVEDKSDVRLGVAVFTFEYCRLYEDIECSVCSRECPFDAIDYVWSEEEYRRIVRIDTKKCTGCGRCVVNCPIVRDSIDIVETPLTIAPLTGSSKIVDFAS